MADLFFLTTGAEFEVFRAGFFPGWGRAGIIVAKCLGVSWDRLGLAWAPLGVLWAKVHLCCELETDTNEVARRFGELILAPL